MQRRRMAGMWLAVQPSLAGHGNAHRALCNRGHVCLRAALCYLFLEAPMQLGPASRAVAAAVVRQGWVEGMQGTWRKYGVWCK